MTEKKKDITENNFFPFLSKYDMSAVKVEDRGLARYININAENIFLGGIFANKMFGKSKMSIVERLINNLMRTEMYNG